MGRRPNALILEFFERGPKLEDASNRYQHTCKSCGERFPKGRIDSLTNHLVKKCPALPLQDRQRALLQFHDIPLPEGMAHMPSPSHLQQHGQTLDLPFATSKSNVQGPAMSALETLAEVSRQQLDQHTPGRQLRKTPQPHYTAGGGHGLLDEFLVHDDRPDGDMTGLSHGMDMASTPALPSIYQFHGPLQHSPSTSPRLASLPLGSSASMAQMVPSLVMAASAANELMPLTNNLTMDSDLGLAHPSMTDKLFQHHSRSQWGNLVSNSIDPLLHEPVAREHLLLKDEMDQTRQSTQPRPLALNPSSSQTHFTSDFSLSQKTIKPKVRGRFSDSRRKEVQEVRKRGACIRCRMLKKPCSGDSPCHTCQNVESARLWKQPCIRTRIAEEFNLYTAGLHGVLAFQAVSQAKGQHQLEHVTGRIEATHHPDTEICSTFAPLRSTHHTGLGSDIDPAILSSVSGSALDIIDTDDDIGGKVDAYIKKAVNDFIESEDSTFMKSTLQTAFEITSSSPDGLMSKALELWNLTRILTSRSLVWHIFYNTSLAPTLTPSLISTSDPESALRTPISPTDNHASYELISLQLMGATEKRAACMARTLMNEVERRLLQRQQSNPTETFLVAVVLLACVERMCWLFRTWDDLPQQSENVTSVVQVNEDGMHETCHNVDPISPPPDVVPASRHPRWPFDRPPAYYWQQGERFSDILNMLLNMRGVPPKPATRGTDEPLAMSGDDDVDEKIRTWYERIAMTPVMVAERRNAVFVGHVSNEWELKFISKIIAYNN